MRREVARGMLAGAAGTTALNATTYLDMALRGKGASDMPERVVEESARRAGKTVPGDIDTQANRRQALAPLLGIGVGTAVGTVAGVARAALQRKGHDVPVLIAVPVVGGSAMAAPAISMMTTGVSDPREWGFSDWAADIIPHLAYGAVTVAALRMLADWSIDRPRFRPPSGWSLRS